MPELLHPRMADVYREKVGNLCRALESEESRTVAVEAIRALIETILLEPDGERLKVTLKGDPARMLTAA
jgi:site-specific DNA recombinase